MARNFIPQELQHRKGCVEFEFVQTDLIGNLLHTVDRRLGVDVGFLVGRPNVEGFQCVLFWQIHPDFFVARLDLLEQIEFGFFGLFGVVTVAWALFSK